MFLFQFIQIRFKNTTLIKNVENFCIHTYLQKFDLFFYRKVENDIAALVNEIDIKQIKFKVYYNKEVITQGITTLKGLCETVRKDRQLVTEVCFFILNRIYLSSKL